MRWLHTRKLRQLLADRPGAARLIGAVLVCAVGAWVVAPGIDGRVLADYVRSDGAGPLLRLYDWLVGGALSRGAFLALGLLPYVTARIYLRLAKTLGPRAAALAGRTGTTRVLTLGFAAIQSYGFAQFVQSLPGAVAQPGVGFVARTVVVLTASAMAAMWMYERVGGAAVPSGYFTNRPTTVA